MRKIKDCYEKADSTVGLFGNKGYFYVGKTDFINTIDCGNIELSYDRNDNEIYLEEKTGQNYRRIKSDKDVKHQP